MKKKVDLKYAKYAYLHCDGSLLVVHAKYNYKTKKDDEWAKLYKNVVENRASKKQVVIHHKSALALLLRCDGIGYIEPGIQTGSNLQEKIGYVLLYMRLNKEDSETFYVPFVPGIVGSEFTFNDESRVTYNTFEEFKEVGKCGFNINIVKVIE